MITNFKIFENIEKETTFVINDLVDYYNKDWHKIFDFINDLLHDKLVFFNCKECRGYINNSFVGIKHNKSHKGIVNSIGLGHYDHDNSVYLSLSLKRIRYIHEVDVKLPMIIYGDISDNIEKIINEINLIKTTKKYNL